MTPFFNGMVQYASGRAYNDASGINLFPANNWDPRLNLLGTLRWRSLVNLGIGLSLNSGAPYSMTTGRDDNHDSLANDRPAGVPRNFFGHAVAARPARRLQLSLRLKF